MRKVDKYFDTQKAQKGIRDFEKGLITRKKLVSILKDATKSPKKVIHKLST